jgi:hypothetical protein
MALKMILISTKCKLISGSKRFRRCHRRFRKSGLLKVLSRKELQAWPNSRKPSMSPEEDEFYSNKLFNFML